GKPAAIAHIAKEQGMQGWSEDRWTELRAVYYGMCARIDHQFGLVVSALKEAGLYDDTAMFFFSDHGDFTGDYGVVQKFNNQMCDVLSRVPFLVKPPANHAVKPRVSDALVELVDLPATVFEMTGIKPDYHQFGKSLLPVLKGESNEHRDAVFCQGGRLKGESLNDVFEFQKRGKTSEYWTTNVVCTSDDNATHGPASGKATMCRTREYKYVHRLLKQTNCMTLKAILAKRKIVLMTQPLQRFKHNLKTAQCVST
ncbi:MAG: sulfatase-like hydrolase/transferase, partial [Phycisphaeraceae bacterium]|nr:sulfatase-like hydrolase/transferase [Phycisphaeraceae bacterium]